MWHNVRRYPLAKLKDRIGSHVVIDFIVSERNELCLIVQCDCGSNPYSVKNYLFHQRKNLYCYSCRSETRKILGDDLRMWYTRWLNMHRRCYNKDAENYRYYGARGIRVCKRWHSFLNFAKDIVLFDGFNLASKHILNLEMDRINSKGNYSPKNVQLVAREENLRRQNEQKTRNSTRVRSC
jgi:hypothetical protein